MKSEEEETGPLQSLRDSRIFYIWTFYFEGSTH